MSKTANMIRRESGVTWGAVWRAIGQEPPRVNNPGRRLLKLKHGLLKMDVIAASHGHGPLASWLADAVICQAVLNVAKALQTDIEDFAPTAQPTRRDAISSA